MISEVRIPVRYAETDRMGVVYHANYLIWLEVGRTDFLEKIGVSYNEMEKQGYMSPVLEVHVSYGESLTYGDVAIVRTTVVKQTAVRTTYAYEVYKEGQVIGKDKPCCTATTVHCVVDAKTFAPKGLKRVAPDFYEAYLAAMEPDFVS